MSPVKNSVTSWAREAHSTFRGHELRSLTYWEDNRFVPWHPSQRAGCCLSVSWAEDFRILFSVCHFQETSFSDCGQLAALLPGAFVPHVVKLTVKSLFTKELSFPVGFCSGAREVFLPLRPNM